MAQIQYDTLVPWDITLADVGYTDSETIGAAFAGLVESAIKITSGAPTATAGKFIPGAIIQNAVTGINYQNTGSTASPTWTVISTGGGVPALTSAHIFVGNGSNVATDVAMSGVIAITNAGVTSIVDGSVVNADLSASAAIAFSKLATLADGNILVGSALGVAVSVPLSGDATIINTGALTIANGAISTAKIANNAVDGTKIALATQATGDIMYYNGTDWVVLPIGTAGQTLKVNGGATAPEWVT